MNYKKDPVFKMMVAEHKRLLIKGLKAVNMPDNDIKQAIGIFHNYISGKDECGFRNNFPPENAKLRTLWDVLVEKEVHKKGPNKKFVKALDEATNQPRKDNSKTG